jgi:hypothetical protein
MYHVLINYYSPRFCLPLCSAFAGLATPADNFGGRSPLNADYRRREDHRLRVWGRWNSTTIPRSRTAAFIRWR